MHFAASAFFAAFFLSTAAWAIPREPPSCDTRVVGGSEPANAPAVGLVSRTGSTVDLKLFQRGVDQARLLGRFELGGAGALRLVDGRTLLAVPLSGLVAGETYALQLSETCADGPQSGRSTELHPTAEAPLPTRLGTLDGNMLRPDPAIGAFAGVVHVRVFANDVAVEDILGFYPDRDFGIDGAMTRACREPGPLEVQLRLEAEVIGSGVPLEVPVPAVNRFTCADEDLAPVDEPPRDAKCSAGWGGGSPWPLALFGLTLLRRRRAALRRARS